MPAISYWESQTFIGRPDVVIVGAGFVGLRTALSIRAREKISGERPRDIMVIDRHSFGLGASTRNAGFACFGSPTEILADLEHGDEAAVWDTIERRYKGVERLREELSNADHWKLQGGYEVFLDKGKYEWVMDQLPRLNRRLSERLGKGARWLPSKTPEGLKSELPVLYNAAEAKLQPAELLKYLQEKCRTQGIRLVYGCEVKAMNGQVGEMQIETVPLGIIECDLVLVATNAFSNQLGLDLDLKPQRNMVLLTEPIPGLELPGTYHHHEGYVYFRTVESTEGPRVLIGGARHLDEEAETMEFEVVRPSRHSCSQQSHGISSFEKRLDLRKSLKSYLLEFLSTPKQDVQITHLWTGILAQGSNKIPIIKRLQSGLFVAVRLAGMGVAMSGEVADTAAELLLEEVG
ncbi:MAG: FAD-dependent oxidoreductase [Bacteroidota bacterium]